MEKVSRFTVHFYMYNCHPVLFLLIFLLHVSTVYHSTTLHHFHFCKIFSACVYSLISCHVLVSSCKYCSQCKQWAKGAAILGSTYRIWAYQPTFTHIGIGCFVTDMADNELRMRKLIYCCLTMCWSFIVVYLWV